MDAIRLGRVIAGKYRLEAPVARGGMGSVWKARHLQLETLVAVKFINLDQRATSGGRARFEREAKAAALLHGPNVIEVYDYGVDDGLPYLVMELLEGEDLSRRIAREGRLPVGSVVSLIGQVTRALRRAHEAGIVHRDLKPGNIFLVEREDDEEPLVKVLDFGIARTPRLGFVGEATKTGTLLGSPRYMSPEQARSPRSVDPRSDLWSLAVIAFRALTGRLPFMADEVAELLVKICTEPAPPPSSFHAELADFDLFFEKAFSRNPDERFQTARELAIDFATCAGIPPPSSRLLASTTGSRSFDRAKVLAAAERGAQERAAFDRGATDLVAIATIVPEAARSEPAPEVSDARAAMRATIPEGRLRSHPHGEGTLTESPRTIDVPFRMPAPRPTLGRMWLSAALVALAGLVVGAALALNVLSATTTTMAAATPTPTSLPIAMASDAAPVAVASVAGLDAAGPAAVMPISATPQATNKADPARKPRPPRPAVAPPIPSATPSASPPPRAPGRRNFTLGI
jgi:serine/threonine-protein kinase